MKTTFNVYDCHNTFFGGHSTHVKDFDNLDCANSFVADNSDKDYRIVSTTPSDSYAGSSFGVDYYYHS